MGKNRHSDIIVEDLTNAFERLLEVVSTLRTQVDNKVSADQFETLRQRIALYDYSFKKINDDLRAQNTRITQLESR